MREAYYKCKNNRSKLTRSGAKASKLPTCNYYNVLTFLSETTGEDNSISVTCNIREGNLTAFTSTSPAFTKGFGGFQPDELLGRKAFNPRKRKTHNQDNEAELILMNTLQNVNKQIQENKEENLKKSSNVLFCKSLVEILDGLSPEQNMEARIKMQQILFEIRYKK